MATYGQMVITNQGSALYGKVQTGVTLTFTRLQIGSGQFATSATLSAALTSGTAYTTLAVNALTGPIPNGSAIVIGSGASTQTVTISADVATGATSISVTSFTANANYAVSTPLATTPNETALTALLTPIDYFAINSITDSDGTATVRGIYQNTLLSASTYTCEIGLYAQDPQDGEILYAYANAEGNGDNIPPYSSGPYSMQFQLNVASGNATSVTATIPADTYIPTSDIGTANGVPSLDANGQVPADQLGNVVAPSDATPTAVGLLLASDAASEAHPVAVTTDNAKYKATAVTNADNAFTAKQTFSAGVDLPAGQSGTIEGALSATGSGIIHATLADNATNLGGHPSTYYLPATAQAADSAKLNGQSASYYATASSVPTDVVESLTAGTGISVTNPSGKGSATVTNTAPNASASGVWTPTKGMFNVVAGTIFNIAAVPSSATMYQTFNMASLAIMLNTVGIQTAQGSVWSATASYIGEGSQTMYTGSSSGISSTTVTGTQVNMVDGPNSYEVEGYFQINNGYLQYVVVSSGGTNSSGVASTIRWGVS